MARGPKYLVVGSTGDYEDYRQWSVAVFTYRSRAVTWRDKCQQHVPPPHRFDMEKWINPYDPYMEYDWNGVRYFIERVREDPPHPTVAEIRAIQRSNSALA